MNAYNALQRYIGLCVRMVGFVLIMWLNHIIRIGKMNTALKAQQQ